MTKWSEMMEKRLRKLREAAKNLGELAAGIEVPGSQELDDLKAAVESQFRSTLSGENFCTPGFPDVGHERLVARALRREQPFDSQGKDGYRDALLWETVIEFAAEQNVVLVSNDLKAFAGGDKDELSKQLQAEVTDRTGRQDAVELCVSLEQAVEQFASEDVVVAERAARLVRVSSFRTILTEELEEAIGSHYPNALERASLGFPVDVPYAHTVGLTTDLGKITVDRAFQIGDGLGLVDLSIYAGVQIGFFAPFAQAKALRDRKDVWPAQGLEWDEIDPNPSGEAHLMTARLGLLRVECAIQLVPGTIKRLQVIAFSPVTYDDYEDADPAINEEPGDVWPAGELESSSSAPSG
jgi:hypothetical protein